MNFYEHQERARKQTVWLLVLLFLALASLTLLAAIFFAGVGFVFNSNVNSVQLYGAGHSFWNVLSQALSWEYLGSISIVIVLTVSIAALFRMAQLSSGGQAIAEQLGGRLVNTSPRNNAEKRLLNVVEEMAIAAGTPVPSVYLIEEEGINAFAAGFQSADAVIGVTRGAVEHLSRHELQGVIAHEFSHILNGDMRLNLRLIGIIYGIVVISECGYHLLARGHNTSRGRNNALSIGLALVVLGSLGTFFGNVIKAAISRQREFLADASAVQFTRSKDGIAGALKKIGGQQHYAVWEQRSASEISHMLFSQGLDFYFLNRLMATHPPLEQRITRVDPQWDGTFVLEQKSTVVEEQSISPKNQYERGDAWVSTSALLAELERPVQLSDDVIAEAKSNLAIMAVGFDSLRQSVHQPYNACALIYAMLIEAPRAKSSLQLRQWQDLQNNQAPELYKQTQTIYKSLQDLNPSQVMTVLDLALPVLKMLSDNQYQQLKKQMLRLIQLDKKIELREWGLFNLVNYFCRPKKLHSLHWVSLRNRKPVIAKLLSALAALGKRGEQSFKKVVKNELGFELRWYPAEELTIQSLNQALEQVRLLKPLEKPRLLKACIGIVEHDGVIDASELNVLVCIAQAIDCPLPPRIL